MRMSYAWIVLSNKSQIKSAGQYGHRIIQLFFPVPGWFSEQQIHLPLKRYPLYYPVSFAGSEEDFIF